MKRCNWIVFCNNKATHEVIPSDYLMLLQNHHWYVCDECKRSLENSFYVKEFIPLVEKWKICKIDSEGNFISGYDEILNGDKESCINAYRNLYHWDGEIHVEESE